SARWRRCPGRWPAAPGAAGHASGGNRTGNRSRAGTARIRPASWKSTSRGDLEAVGGAGQTRDSGRHPRRTAGKQGEEVQAVALVGAEVTLQQLDEHTHDG